MNGKKLTCADMCCMAVLAISVIQYAFQRIGITELMLMCLLIQGLLIVDKLKDIEKKIDDENRWYNRTFTRMK